ncbi:type III pantothenate kinase [Collimonas sp.]|jgi:type III pantothenate kinase|uniref:type III pantothenate kinase n=1 Tax=Collimonas sp. TaxID=1963772 RepID=UPI0037BE23D1
MTMLLIDVGNTRIKWASAALPEAAAQAPGQWLDSGSAAHSELPQLAVHWARLTVSRVLVSNVAGAPLGERLHAVLEASVAAQVPVNWFASLPQLGPLRNGYRQPAQLGCDRFAAALGAQRLFPRQSLIVATCGTATTIDAVSAEGLFVGGMILPGLGLMAAALARSTAQLPHIREHVEVTAVFADNTDDAIISGCINAQAGAIERAVVQHGRQYPDSKIRCIVSGGSATVIAPYLSIEHETVDNLVLIGLQAAATYLSTPLC